MFYMYERFQMPRAVAQLVAFAVVVAADVAGGEVANARSH